MDAGRRARSPVTPDPLDGGAEESCSGLPAFDADRERAIDVLRQRSCGPAGPGRVRGAGGPGARGADCAELTTATGGIPGPLIAGQPPDMSARVQQQRAWQEMSRGELARPSAYLARRSS